MIATPPACVMDKKVVVISCSEVTLVDNTVINTSVMLYNSTSDPSMDNDRFIWKLYF